MRIARFAADGDPRYGVVELAEDGGQHPETVAALTGDPLAGPVQLTGVRHELAAVRLLAPVIPRSKVVGVGRNFAAHAAELGNEVPGDPLIFLKPNTSVIGPEDQVVHPPTTELLSYEGELAVVIGRICREVPASRAADVIFGYTIANDVTARDLQKSDGQWARAKGYDTFCPLGPWMVTHLTLEEAGDLQITTTLDGEVKQDGSTSLMVHPIPALIEWVTSFTTLLPGDVILTGTPAGVGRMQPGQEVSVTIAGIGTLTNTVASADAVGPATDAGPGTDTSEEDPA
ncbi:fumarylacetoacetate hydrolase family protein [Auraticoccus monumenti]|uniref:2-keto-4-pentenoate hydratase/2-oxohepta-3-ene-1,7-dioic acid hydratase (Catechol pathway) n=1 Tax=Auraticoccus monumenti TaxID=675864 RepID=A0A1G7CPL6_9ACTN|nr:fumarylacetoacetate hydrolase family protein [Auraticoccus monumenti]SDE41259.1 2-keto-4-pentenoate hydratase/2-oxohepta-3-ene-1,7-dioic acid hydratase (catechol pathway) [Auraticoccus monumenti]